MVNRRAAGASRRLVRRNLCDRLILEQTLFVRAQAPHFRAPHLIERRRARARRAGREEELEARRVLLARALPQRVERAHRRARRVDVARRRVERLAHRSLRRRRRRRRRGGTAAASAAGGSAVERCAVTFLREPARAPRLVPRVARGGVARRRHHVRLRSRPIPVRTLRRGRVQPTTARHPRLRRVRPVRHHCAARFVFASRARHPTLGADE